MSDDTVSATARPVTAVRNDATAPDVTSLRIALIGFGEVGGIFGAALVKRGVAQVTAFDVLLGDASSPRAATASRTPCWRRSPKRFPASTGREAATISSVA